MKHPLFLQSQKVLCGVYPFDRLPATAGGTGRAGSELIEGLRMTIRAFGCRETVSIHPIEAREGHIIF